MADRKITELGAINASSIADDDLYTLVDVSEVDPGLKNKKFTFASSKEYYNFYYLQLTGGTVYGNLTVTGNLSVGGNFSPATIDVTGVSTFNRLNCTGTGTFTSLLSGANITGAVVNVGNLFTDTGNILDLTVTTITGGSGNFVRLSGQTVTGATGAFTNVTGQNISGITASITTISGTNVTVTSTISGATITGDTGNFTKFTATNITGTTITGATGQYSVLDAGTGKFTLVSGATVTGTTGQLGTLTGGTGNFVLVSGDTVKGTTITGTTGQIVNLTSTSGFFTYVSGGNVTGDTGNFSNLTADTGSFTYLTGTTISGATGNFNNLSTDTGTFTLISGTTVTGDTGNFTSITAATGTFTSSLSFPSLTLTGDLTVGKKLYVGEDALITGITTVARATGYDFIVNSSTSGNVITVEPSGVVYIQDPLVIPVANRASGAGYYINTGTTNIVGDNTTLNYSGGNGFNFEGNNANGYYGNLVVPNLISTDTITGSAATFSNLTGSTTISGGTIYGNTITGTTGQFPTLTGGTGTFTLVSGTTVTGSTGSFTQATAGTGTFTLVSGTTVTGTTGKFANLTGGTGTFTLVTGTTVQGATGDFDTISGTSGIITTISGVTLITGITASFTTGNFTVANFVIETTGNITTTGGYVSGASGLFTDANITGLIISGSGGNFDLLTGGTITGTTGDFATVNVDTGVFTYLTGTTISSPTGYFGTLTVDTGITRYILTVTGDAFFAEDIFVTGSGVFGSGIGSTGSSYFYQASVSGSGDVTLTVANPTGYAVATFTQVSTTGDFIVNATTSGTSITIAQNEIVLIEDSGVLTNESSDGNGYYQYTGALDLTEVNTEIIYSGGIASGFTFLGINYGYGTNLEVKGIISGTTITGNTGNFGTGSFTYLTGTTVSGGTGSFNSLNVLATGAIKLYDADSTNWVAFKSADTVSTNVTWVLPATDATTSGDALLSDAAGTLSWGAVASLSGITDDASPFTTALGAGAGTGITSDGTGNTAVGYQALNTNTNGDYNTALGYQSAYSGTTASGIVAIGYQSLYKNNGRWNIGIGSEALIDNITGVQNIAIGFRPASGVTNISQSTVIGHVPCLNATSVQFSHIIGDGAVNSGSAYQSIVIGAATLANGTGNYGTYIGVSAGKSSSGSYNIAIGHKAASGLIGNNCIVIGSGAGTSLANDNNTIIGSITGTAADNGVIRIGAGTTERIYVGTDGAVSGATFKNANWTLPTADATVSGYVLKSDANGTLSWGQGATNTDTVYTVTNASPTLIDPTNGGIQLLTLTANRTLSYNNFLNGDMILLMINDGSNYTVTWPTTSWIDGSPPSLSTSNYTVISLWKASNVVYAGLMGYIA